MAVESHLWWLLVPVTVPAWCIALGNLIELALVGVLALLLWLTRRSRRVVVVREHRGLRQPVMAPPEMTQPGSTVAR